MRLIVNQSNIRQFVNDMITKTLRSSATLSQMDLAICSAIIQVCVQGGDYRNLMTGGED